MLIPTEIMTSYSAEAAEQFGAQFRILYRNSPLLIAVFDEKDQLRAANAAFRLAYGLCPDTYPTWSELMRQNHQSGHGALIKTDDIERWISSAFSRRGKQPFRAFEADLCDGRWIWMTETVQDGGWMMCVACDISQLRTEERALRLARDVAQRSAQTDSLTGISNRFHILQLLEQKLEDHRQNESDYSVAILDLDHFKHINDTYGHQAGDEALYHFAQCAQKTIRRADCIGRLGGEEFMLLFPKAGVTKASKVIERIRHAMQEHPLQIDGHSIHYTFSAGITELLTEDCSREAYSRADAALLEAKANGRNQLISRLAGISSRINRSEPV